MNSHVGRATPAVAFQLASNASAQPSRELLQTDPYLTCIRAGDHSPIVYAIDELDPVVPDIAAPADAVFGVIGLDRSVVWHRNRAALGALHHAAPQPVPRQSLVAKYGTGLISDLVVRGWLQDPDQLCTGYLLTTAQIEITAHCNWGCAFCPVSVDAKPAATMPMPLFEEIIAKLTPFDTLRYVTFHFYNEPTLDRFFSDRVAVLAQQGLRLRLFTNASNLTTEKIENLRRSDVLCQLVVNLPALSESEFYDITRSKTHTRTLRNLESAIDAGLRVQIIVNGNSIDLRTRVEQLRARYDRRGVAVTSTLLSDRAGALDGGYHQAVRVDGPLRGCAWPVNHAHFSVRGDMFICCNDYYQREVFGNITSGTIDEIMTGRDAVMLRRRVFGVADAPSDYLCRSCHDQLPDFPRRQFRPLASFPLQPVCSRGEAGCG